jgi:hypothetical protein
MQYVLGNMLNGGGINPDGLSLDLQFAADKALTARRGPTPTFTRSSGDNGGTTYFGPLVDFDEATAFSTTGISNGRASWFKSYEGTDITISYTGTRWRVVTVDNGDVVTFLAAPGGEWRPDQADWSGQDFSVTTSSTFGIVKAANNEPRFAHTSAGVCRGLLIEEGRTNLLSRSEGLDANPWFPVNTTTITSNDATAPDGATTAERFTVGATTQSYGVFNSTPSWTAGVTYTTSFFCKADQITRVRIAAGNQATHPISAIFDLTGNGSIVGTPTGTASIERYANGWYRCSVTATSTATGTTSLRLTAVTGTTDNYPGNSVDSFLAWGAQNEVGSFPTSYIPTTTGTLARGADVCSITGGNFNNFYNQSEGTLFADATPQTVDQLAVVVGVNTTTFQNSHLLYKINSTALAAGKRWVANTNVAGPTQSSLIPTPTDIAVSRGILSYAYKLNDMAFAANGTLIGTDNNGTMPFPTVMRIGGRDDGLQLNGHLASIRYYKKRLPNAKIQALTA